MSKQSRTDTVAESRDSIIAMRNYRTNGEWVAKTNKFENDTNNYESKIKLRQTLKLDRANAVNNFNSADENLLNLYVKAGKQLNIEFDKNSLKLKEFFESGKYSDIYESTFAKQTIFVDYLIAGLEKNINLLFASTYLEQLKEAKQKAVETFKIADDTKQKESIAINDLKEADEIFLNIFRKLKLYLKSEVPEKDWHFFKL